MKVSSAVIIALWATSSPATAFTPPQLSTANTNTHRRTTRIFAEEGNAAASEAASAASEAASSSEAAAGTAEAAAEAAATVAGAGISTSQAVPFLAPIAALVAGRQSLIKRDIVREQVALTEKDLARIKKDLRNVDINISVREDH